MKPTAAHRTHLRLATETVRTLQPLSLVKEMPVATTLSACRSGCKADSRLCWLCSFALRFDSTRLRRRPRFRLRGRFAFFGHAAGATRTAPTGARRDDAVATASIDEERERCSRLGAFVHAGARREVAPPR